MKYCLWSEAVELISGERMGSASTLHLPFDDHMHLYERVPLPKLRRRVWVWPCPFRRRNNDRVNS
ncbi:hypothetical protein BN2475_450033 [Paraburkholderia ribeironis]|uniref:Uncharacterized protein n=1 Tax=Paraburkholderia ribeironis TaxID=1247936 RepID=A0A1N7S8M4_9BURK|nr:hypothetical protein BN2475_450033 [Paraburkholderia ribeironis]